MHPPHAGNCFPLAISWAGLHDNVPDRPSAKVAAPVGCELATVTLTIKTVSLSQEVGLHGRSCHPAWVVSASGLSCTRLADFQPHRLLIHYLVSAFPAHSTSVAPNLSKYSTVECVLRSSESELFCTCSRNTFCFALI